MNFHTNCIKCNNKNNIMIEFVLTLIKIFSAIKNQEEIWRRKKYFKIFKIFEAPIL